MADSNLPASAGPDVSTPPEPTYDEHVEDISKLLDDPQPADPVDRAEDAPAADTAAEDDDPLGMNDPAEAVAADDADNPDGPEDPEIKGGRFAPDSAKVTLDDGTVTTIAELKRGTLFQRDYTQKTTALSEERKSFEAERDQVSQYAQSLSQFRDYAAWYAETYMPTPPEDFVGDPGNDPVGYLQWQAKRDNWTAHQQAFLAFQQQRQQESDLKAGETAKQAEARHKREAQALLDAIPVLKDPAKAKGVWDAIVSGAQQHYGLDAQAVNGIRDHKYLVVLRDALELKRIKGRAATVQAEVRRPPVREARRAPAGQQASREKQALSERAKSGSFDAGVALLSKLNI